MSLKHSYDAWLQCIVSIPGCGHFTVSAEVFSGNSFQFLGRSCVGLKEVRWYQRSLNLRPSIALLEQLVGKYALELGSQCLGNAFSQVAVAQL